MSSFWQTWRREIIRGAVLFCGVIAIGLFVRHMVGHVRQRVAMSLPAALKDLRNLRSLENLKGDFDFDVNAGPRDTANTWTYGLKLKARQWVWIHNTNGSVKVESATGDSLVVTAVKTYHRSDPAAVSFVTVPSADGVTICAVWASRGGRCEPGGDFKPSLLHGNDVAVDFSVRLPRGVRLGATTVNGGVRIAGATAPRVAVTVNGAVRARMLAFGDTGDVSLFTVNGSATAELPAHLDADVEARTVNGSIQTDYPLEVTGKVGKHVHGMVGVGGRKVQVTTVNGSINLRKSTGPR